MEDGKWKFQFSTFFKFYPFDTALADTNFNFVIEIFLNIFHYMLYDILVLIDFYQNFCLFTSIFSACSQCIVCCFVSPTSLPPFTIVSLPRQTPLPSHLYFFIFALSFSLMMA